MNKILVSVAASAILVQLGGCAGRTAAPIAITQVGDDVLSCNQLQAEIARNRAQAETLMAQNKKAGDANVAIGVVGAILFWPALFALDTGTAEKDEAKALGDRNTVLTAQLARRNCAMATEDLRATNPQVEGVKQ